MPARPMRRPPTLSGRHSLGSEAHWPRWLTGLGNAPAILPLFSADFLRYMAFWPSPGPAYRVTDFDFSADPARMAPQAQVYNAATYDPAAGAVRPVADLSAFRDAGGKLLIYMAGATRWSRRS